MIYRNYLLDVDIGVFLGLSFVERHVVLDNSRWRVTTLVVDQGRENLRGS